MRWRYSSWPFVTVSISRGKSGKVQSEPYKNYGNNNILLSHRSPGYRRYPRPCFPSAQRYANGSHHDAHFLGLIEIILGIVVSSTPPRACYSGRSDSAFAIFYTASVRTQNTVRTKKLRPNIYKVFEIRIRSGVLCKGKENILQHLFSPGEKFSIFE